MMKATFPTLILLVILAVGCGVKGPLTPPDVLVAKAIMDLKGTVRDEGFYLTWSIPEENMDGSTPVDLVRFEVLRREETRGCPECPGEFTVRAELDLRSPKGYRLEDDTVSWGDTDLREGVIYMYKIIGVNHWGYQSPPSNEVMIRWGGPKE
jgi:predicted small lipoprotein YifL